MKWCNANGKKQETKLNQYSWEGGGSGKEGINGGREGGKRTSVILWIKINFKKLNQYNLWPHMDGYIGKTCTQKY